VLLLELRELLMNTFVVAGNIIVVQAWFYAPAHGQVGSDGFDFG